MVSYLLDLPEEDEEEEERPEINTPDSLWGETGSRETQQFTNSTYEQSFMWKFQLALYLMPNIFYSNMEDSVSIFLHVPL